MKYEEHRSPDGAFTLVVSHKGDDITIGFAGFQWHTHGDLLAASYAASPGPTPEVATQRFVEDLVSNRAIIAVLSSGNRIRDVLVTDDIDQELQYKQADEEIEFRYWDGTNAQSAG